MKFNLMFELEESEDDKNIGFSPHLIYAVFFNRVVLWPLL